MNQARRDITLAPGETFRETRPRLEFLTGSALFGYDLKQGQTYRVIAVYRPAGEKSSGFSSREAVITTR